MLCDGEPLNDFLEVLPRSTGQRSQRESHRIQAATGRMVKNLKRSEKAWFPVSYNPGSTIKFREALE